MYTCDRCGRKFDDAYNITKYWNGGTSIQTVCLECIEKIGHENGTSDNDSDMSNDDNVSPDR